MLEALIYFYSSEHYDLEYFTMFTIKPIKRPNDLIETNKQRRRLHLIFSFLFSFVLFVKTEIFFHLDMQVFQELDLKCLPLFLVHFISKETSLPRFFPVQVRHLEIRN